MRVRLTVEYDTDEGLEFEHKAWQDGDVSLVDFEELAQDHDGSVVVRFEVV